MRARRPKGTWYLPGRLYDLAFGRAFRKLRRRVAAEVERGGLYPWLDVCCGTGLQFRGDAIKGKGSEGNSAGLRSGLDIGFGFVRYGAARAPGVPFVCGDAAKLPFGTGALRAVSISFGLHDKSPALRRAIVEEARRVLAPGGRLIAVDFEKPWSPKSRRWAFLTVVIERFAGGDHYRNGREFVARGGLRAFLREHGFVEVSRRDVESGCLGIVVAQPGDLIA
jgi:ubiquinone/menaquinone biosynthesis C-methylase UbiE